MAYGVFNPTVPDSANDLLLGEGAVYKNYGELGQAALGATSGGSKLEIDRKIKEVKYDGGYGKTKNMSRYDTFEPKLTVKFLKLTYTNMVAGLPVTVSDGTDADGTYKEISFDMEIAAADVLTNVAFVGQKFDGTACSIILENALNLDKISIDFKEKDEVVSEMTYTGFYAYATPTTPPLLIKDGIPA
jgi:hypothetical protein